MLSPLTYGVRVDHMWQWTVHTQVTHTVRLKNKWRTAYAILCMLCMYLYQLASY
ncbi:hypothetical protein ASPWEDRAFT_36069 [Aspergillus wentii DTO 134E9]|uniref:Uncharacterized protein n=1 Tax=Aspergillus wentii DTO 134E9 TaxID=1073089 RepID=A0A1L9RU16_ASPWE|nr:uncharacterized protein ASPWEDRAFT_36069 [Aspergillus wentii DTO 134E9]OJJ38446.1 hypothetical protein ASPWEDRAFT_36069 [Aspergillus wentii DTO 134E9]